MNCPLTLPCFERSFHHQYPTLSCHVYPSKLTCLTLSSQGSIFPASEISSRVLPQSMYTCDVNVTAFGSGLSKKVHLSIRVIASSDIACSGPVTVFRLDSIAGQIPCCGVSGSPTGVEHLKAEAEDCVCPVGMNIVLCLTTGTFMDCRVYRQL